MALVSFVVPVWRPCAPWLQDAVASALQQEGVDTEVVVVDDGNEVSVGAALGPLARHERVRVLRVEHGGVSAARNAGFDEAHGEFIRYLDADDVAEPGSSARLIALAGEDGTIAYGQTAVCDADLRVRWVMRARQEGDVALDCLLSRWPVRPQSILFPRRVVADTGPWDVTMPISQDWDFVLRAVERAPVRCDASVATFYRRHGASTTANFITGPIAAQKLVNRYFERHPDARGTGLERRTRGMLLALAARIELTRGRPSQAVRTAARAATVDPEALAVQVRQGLPVITAKFRRGPSYVERAQSPRGMTDVGRTRATGP